MEPKTRPSLKGVQEARESPAEAETWAQGPVGTKKLLWLLLMGGSCPNKAPKACISKTLPGLTHFLSVFHSPECDHLCSLSPCGEGKQQYSWEGNSHKERGVFTLHGLPTVTQAKGRAGVKSKVPDMQSHSPATLQPLRKMDSRPPNHAHQA